MEQKKKGKGLAFSMAGLAFITIGIALIQSTPAGYAFLALGFIFGLTGVIKSMQERKK